MPHDLTPERLAELRARYADIRNPRDVDFLKDELFAIGVRLIDAAEENVRLREALAKVEWVAGDVECRACPVCERDQCYGHESVCLIGAALATVPPVEPVVKE